MARKFPKLPSLQNVSANSTATLQVPLGVTYHAIELTYTGITLAQMKNIEVQLNGKTFQEFADGERLQDLNKYYGRNVEAGRMCIWFERPEYDNITLRRATAIGTQNIVTFQINIDIDGAAESPKIEAFAIVSPNRPSLVVTKVKRWVVSNSVEGVKEVADIPKEGKIAALFMFKPDISSLELSINGTKLWELDKVLGEQVQRDYGRKPDGTKYTAVDFHMEGDPAQALIVQGVADFRLRPFFDTAGTGDLVVEYLSGLGGI
jgi:hypothetical protein